MGCAIPPHVAFCTGAFQYIRHMTRLGETSPVHRVPLWIPAVMLALAIIEPATHLWLTHAPPEGYVSTGLHTRETVFLRYWMRPTDWPSPFSIDNDSAWSINAPRVFFYAAGAAGRAISLDDFTTLGWLNGLGTLVLLLGVYAFLRTATPHIANLAFLVYALAGGLGGILYLVTGVLGLHDAPNFEAYFQRYAHYELFQGKFLTPAPLMVYPHYTFPLGLGFAALALAIRALRVPPSSQEAWESHSSDARPEQQLRVTPSSHEGAWGWKPLRHPNTQLLVAAVLLFLGGTLNVRLGPMIWAIFIGYLLAGSHAPIPRRIRAAAILAFPAWAAFLVAWLPIYRQSGSLANQLEYGSAAVWFSPLISATIFHIVAILVAVRDILPRMPRWQRACAYAAIGYLALFTTLYVAHALYYGNLLLPNDTTPPRKFSDVALLGALAGAAMGYSPTTVRSTAHSQLPWIALWFLAFLIFSISAFGGGRWLILTPQRLMVFYGVPLAILSAHGLALLHQRHRVAARALGSTMIACGVLSIAVGAFAFRGPLGPHPGAPPYGQHHAELMRDTDAQCFPHAGPGFILAPLATNPTFGDIAAVHRPDIKVFGVGSFGLSGLDYGTLEADVTTFFAPGTPEETRRSFAERWNVDWIYVPATPAGNGAVADELSAYEWLQPECRQGEAALFKVKPQTEAL